jgi:hypothetical protein
LSIYFQKKGRPIIFSYNSNTSYHAEFTLATLSEDYLSQNTTLTSTSLNNSIARSNPNENESFAYSATRSVAKATQGSK